MFQAVCSVHTPKSVRRGRMARDDGTPLEKGDGREERWERECRSVRWREGEKQRKPVDSKRWEKVEGRLGKVGEGTRVLVLGWFYVPGCSISFKALS